LALNPHSVAHVCNWPILLQNYFERSSEQHLFKFEREGAMLIQKLPCPDSIIASELLLGEFCNNIGPSRQFVVMHHFGSDRTIADMVRASGRYERHVAHRLYAGSSCGPWNGSPHPPRIATLCYVHLGF
jgi:hypothetical protein